MSMSIFKLRDLFRKMSNMKIELSKRLQAVADMITPGNITADIGTDHAYIPIYLIENNIVPKAFAMDINVGPLNIAAAHVDSYGFNDKITLRLSDGLNALGENEAETVVIAGMGGALEIKILSSNMKVVNNLRELILQPQSEFKKFREFLINEGFFIQDENMVLDEGKFYPMLKVLPPSANKKNENWSDTELYYGKYLLESKNEVLKEFILKELSVKKEILNRLNSDDSKRHANRIEELIDEINTCTEGLKFYEM